MVFVDTSSLVALVQGNDARHAAAVDAFVALRAEPSASLLTHEYVVVEAISLLQRRSGRAAVRLLVADLLPIIDVRWVDRELHARSRDALLAADRRSVSLVDQTSFTVMRDDGIRTAFAFDRDFVDQGFEVIPG